MAINRIQGNILADNLQRGSNLSVQGNLAYFDVTNSRVGINTSTPGTALQVVGVSTLGNVTITGNAIASNLNKLQLGANSVISITGGTNEQVLTTDGSGGLSWTTAGNVDALLGNAIDLGTPSDGSLTSNVAYDQWTVTTHVTDGLDDLNQVALNIANSTYVGRVDFSGTPIAGASPMTVTFTGEYVGNPTSFLWDFGDGNTSTAGSSVSHTYQNDSGGTFTVNFTASNPTGTFSGNAAAGARGSVDNESKTNYITLYTPNPIPSFTITDDTIDSGASAEITNGTQYATSFQLDWGAGAGNIDPGDTWTTATNTYTNAGGDTRYTITLYAISNTAGPSDVTVSVTDTIDVFTAQTSQFTANTTTVINQESTSGGVVEFTNTVSTDPGTTAIFGSGQKYLWTWGDSSTNSVNIQSGVAGNPGTPLDHTFALSSSQQSAGTTATFEVQLSVETGHTSSPFQSANVTISVEPDVRAIFETTANIISDRTGDTAQDGYIFTDYRTGASRAQFQFRNDSQNGDIYAFNWGDGTTTGNINNGSAGTPGQANLLHTYTSTGSETLTLNAYGTPGTIVQDDTETKANYLTINSNPSAPGALSSKTLSMSTSNQGTNPKLASSATDQTGGNIPSAGTSVTRYTSSTPIVSGTITNANTSTGGDITAFVNNSADGTTNFTVDSDKTGTYTSLVVVADGDAHTEISASTYPTGFYKVFDARISKALSGLGLGYNDYRLNHSTTGDTNAVGFVKDDMTNAPTVVQGSTTISENTAGTYRYISGIPYYNSGSPSIDITGLAVGDLVGQTYRDTSTPLQFTPGTTTEGTSGSIIGTQTKTYAQIDGSPTFLNGGIPIASTGVGSNYTMGTINVSVNGSARAVGYIDAQMFNVNGSSSVTDLTNKYIQVYSSSLTGFDEENIPVADALGSVFDDDGKRVTGFGTASDTPSYNSATDFYTSNAWTGAVTVAGTTEAIVRWGTVSHFATDLSSGYLPVGGDLATSRSGTQYLTFAFRRATVANFDISLNSSTGITGLWIASPGTAIDNASTLNGWVEGTTQYAGAGVPGADTGNGGNGGNGCALTGADVVPTGSSINAAYTMTLGSANSSNATGNNVLVRIALASGQTLTSVSVGVQT